MNIRLDDDLCNLRAGQMLRLEAASGTALICLSGGLWITEEGDLCDIFLAPGERHLLERDGLSLVTALRASSILFQQPVIQPRTRSLLDRVGLGLFKSLRRPRARASGWIMQDR